MKKINKLWLLAMPLAFAACQNDTFEEFVQPSKGGFTLHATVEDETPQSRAQIQLYNTDKWREYFMWNDQDQISVFNKADLEAGSTTFYISGNELNGNPTKSADFVSLETLEEDTEIAAVYPNVADAPVAEGMIGLEIPNYGNALISNEREHSRNYEESWRNYMKERMFMYASGKVADHSASLHFHHLFAMARITIINTTEQEQRLNTVGLTGDAAYFASHTALDMTTGKTTPINMHNMATVTYNNGGRILQPGESADTYVIFFPGENFTEYGTIQVMNGEQLSPVLDTKEIRMAHPSTPVWTFEQGMRYWFNIVITDEGLAWAKQGGPQITNISLIAAIEEAQGIQFAKTREGYVNVYENYSAIQNITGLNLSEKGLTDLSDIEKIYNLETLVCDNNQIESLDVSGLEKLNWLSVYNNQMKSLVINDNLVELYCQYNALTELDLTRAVKLQAVNAGENHEIKELNVSNCPELIDLDCWAAKLTEIDLSNNHKLQGLNLSNNQLTSINLANLSNLEELSIIGNQLTQLNLSNNRKMVNLLCSNNQLTELNVTHMPMLKRLYCYENQMNKLDVTNNPNLIAIRCGWQRAADGDVKQIAVKLTDEQIANNVVDLDFWANQYVVFGDGIPVIGGNGEVDDFASGGKF